jgi:hypothetical protein
MALLLLLQRLGAARAERVAKRVSDGGRAQRRLLGGGAERVAERITELMALLLLLLQRLGAAPSASPSKLSDLGGVQRRLLGATTAFGRCRLRAMRRPPSGDETTAFGR